ncbi:uncharacterized protein LOC129752971 isoform X2 [Uranotaenia lowii]|uniref:uncharacterized protein LOC129752971 isoform X2 n=1 Tax=Uranotaenia lowii TaxID=190385 RepID=UPI00247ABD0C|nr:uncharacterized protein LOC129752971 isoform X2 [Uranotaenia lowii]
MLNCADMDKSCIIIDLCDIQSVKSEALSGTLPLENLDEEIAMQSITTTQLTKEEKDVKKKRIEQWVDELAGTSEKPLPNLEESVGTVEPEVINSEPVAGQSLNISSARTLLPPEVVNLKETECFVKFINYLAIYALNKVSEIDLRVKMLNITHNDLDPQLNYRLSVGFEFTFERCVVLFYEALLDLTEIMQQFTTPNQNLVIAWIYDMVNFICQKNGINGTFLQKENFVERLLMDFIKSQNEVPNEENIFFRVCQRLLPSTVLPNNVQPPAKKPRKRRTPNPKVTNPKPAKEKPLPASTSPPKKQATNSNVIQPVGLPSSITTMPQSADSGGDSIEKSPTIFSDFDRIPSPKSSLPGRIKPLSPPPLPPPLPAPPAPPATASSTSPVPEDSTGSNLVGAVIPVILSPLPKEPFQPTQSTHGDHCPDEFYNIYNKPRQSYLPYPGNSSPQWNGFVINQHLISPTHVPPTHYSVPNSFCVPPPPTGRYHQPVAPPPNRQPYSTSNTHPYNIGRDCRARYTAPPPSSIVARSILNRSTNFTPYSNQTRSQFNRVAHNQVW